MKALIISEDENVYSTLDNILKKASYDTIIYKWLLKALDNIEEIRPNLIVVSSSEYPRHWKTLVQFVKSGIGGDQVEIYLYEPTPVSAEDEEKAKILGVTGCFNKFEEFEGLVIKETQEPQEVQTAVLRQAQEPHIVEEQSSIPNTGHFMFTHPQSQKFISGKYFDYNGKTMSCSIADKADFSGLSKQTEIALFTFFDNSKNRTARALVKDILELSVNKILVIEILEVYEEN